MGVRVSKKLAKKIKKISLESRLSSAEKFKKKVLKKFGDYIKAIIIFGSLSRGTFSGKSDIDIYLIFDDTKASIKDFQKIRSKIDADIYKLAKESDPRISPQPIIALTEFIDGLRNCHPLFFNIVREGIAIYDTGFFIPTRKLLEMGKFPATPEAARYWSEGVKERLTRVENVKIYMVVEDLYYVFLNLAQAILMFLGVPPPPPPLAANELRAHVVSKGLLDEKYAKMLEDITDLRKRVEHKEVKRISGKEVDEWIEKASEYVKALGSLLKKLDAHRKKTEIERNYEAAVKGAAALLKTSGVKLEGDIRELYKKHVAGKLIPASYTGLLDRIFELKALSDAKEFDKISDRELSVVSDFTRRFLLEVKKVLESGK